LNRAKEIAEFVIIVVISDNRFDPVRKDTAKYRTNEIMYNPVIRGRKKRQLAKTASKAKRRASWKANFVRFMVNCFIIKVNISDCCL
jgi:hypothetical protein